MGQRKPGRHRQEGQREAPPALPCPHPAVRDMAAAPGRLRGGARGATGPAAARWRSAERCRAAPGCPAGSRSWHGGCFG